jgi:hypothetical protein
MKESSFVALECVIEEQEIRGVMHHFPSGPVEGYEWRLRVTFPATPTAAQRTEWLPWVFGSHRSVEAMLQQWQDYMRSDGHLGHSAPPGSSVQ